MGADHETAAGLWAYRIGAGRRGGRERCRATAVGRFRVYADAVLVSAIMNAADIEFSRRLQVVDPFI